MNSKYHYVCISIDKRGKQDSTHEPEVAKLPHEPRISLATKMAVCVREDGTFVKQVKDSLHQLGTGLYCNTFSERGKRQNTQIQKFMHVGHVHELTKALINWNSFTISPSLADVM